MNRARAERLHVGARRVRAAGLLGDCLAEVAASALVTVAHGLLAAADRVGELLGRKAGVGKEVLEGKSAGRLAGEVLEKNACGEALVELVRAVHDAGAAPVSVEGQRTVSGLAPVEVQQLELIGRGHARVELLLPDEDAEWAFRFRLSEVSPPRALDLPERLGREVPDEDLVRWVAERIVERAKRGLDLVRGVLASRLRSVADQVRRVGENQAAAVDGGGHSSTSQTVVGSTSTSSIASARSTILRRSSSSRPNGCVIAGPRTMRFAPIIVATVGRDVT